jgi:hypothetical protein
MLVEVYMSFSLYLIGFILVVGGLCYGAYLMGLSAQWIIIGALVLLGIGIFTGATRTRQKDPAEKA